ncbi:flagellar hook-associated protein FlgK [Algicola sagamiensis]|uniref:flagellar hook-associated protein FlgK n=1 Tax=Algicola sagamiensis TaxID=163869 RepID=UPI00037AC699|nr:flagellar hook-associated protein FlgK [Algicola sagamiensis]
MASLLDIGISGLRASARLLQTTSTNISNLNTTGYVRQRTNYVTQFDGTVGRGTTSRVLDEFAQRQVVRDTSNFKFHESYLQEASRLDVLFSDAGSSLNTQLDNLFKELQSATNNPSVLANRQLVIGQMESLVNRFDAFSDLVLQQEESVNGQLDIHAQEANDLIQEIAELNNKIAGQTATQSGDMPNTTLDQRDEAIRKLSELLDIQVLESSKGEKLIFMASGEALVMEENEFNLLVANGDPDPRIKSIQLQYTKNNNVTTELDIDDVGGKIGGILSFRQTVLEPTQNKLGQLGLALADAFNTQNRLGMDLDGEIGGDLFTIPSFGAQGFQANTASAGTITATVQAGSGTNLTPNNFLITMTSATTFNMEAIDEKGNVIAGSTVAGTVGTPLNQYGLTITTTAPLANGNRYVLKPAFQAAASMQLATTRPEDLALASPIRTEKVSTNTGSADISPGTVTNTGAGSNFNAPGSLTVDPVYVRYDGGNQFSIFNGDPNAGGVLIGTTPALTNFNNILSNVPATANYGYDFNISGTPDTNDLFTVRYNTGGFNDNRNGLELVGMQEKDLMKRNAVAATGADNGLTMHESYSSTVSFVGQKTASARTNEAAFGAILSQAEARYESVSGVNQDEEAADLIKFQQTYSAAAQVISTARTVFDTLLAAAR